MEILQVKNLSFRYPDSKVNALNNVSFDVKQGEFVVICGESGCGKSTLLRTLKKEIAPYGDAEGDILYNGVEISGLDARIAASEIGLVMQNPDAQIVTDFVWHELAFGLESLGLDNSAIRRRTAEMASYFGIQEWYNKKTDELSGGQKQLLNLASVMAMQPKLLLLDEPTAQLDPIAAGDFISTLHKLNSELGLTVVIVEHRLEEVLPISDRVMLMEQGSIRFFDDPKRLSSYLSTGKSHPMLAGMPSAVRIFNELGDEGDAPLTVRECRSHIIANYRNDIKIVEQPTYEPEGDTVYELADVWFRYFREGRDVISGVSFKVQKGEHFCILGGNGTGKTTLLNILAGINKPYRGRMLLNGKKTTAYKGNSLYKSNVALLPQNPQDLFIAMTLKEDLVEVCNARGMNKKDAEEAVLFECKRLSIDHLLDVHPYDLSGGEQQKAALAKILLTNPTVLLLDEPTKGIDAGAKENLASILSELCNSGMTVITVTHDVEFAARHASRCAMFFDGVIVSSDTPNAFFSENSFYTTAASRITRGFYENAVLCEDVVALCRANGKKGKDDE